MAAARGGEDGGVSRLARLDQGCQGAFTELRAASGPGVQPHALCSLVHRTDALLLRLSLVVGKEVFYASLWGSVLASPAVRLPASLFVVGHLSRDLPGKEQTYMMGMDYQLTVGALLPPGGEGPWGHAGTCHWGCQGALGGSRETGSEGVC